MDTLPTGALEHPGFVERRVLLTPRQDGDQLELSLSGNFGLGVQSCKIGVEVGSRRTWCPQKHSRKP